MCIFIQNSLNFTTRNDLNENTKNIESLLVEIINKNLKNLDHITHLEPPQGETKPLDNLYSHSGNYNKLPYITGDFNLNALDYNNSVKIKNS